MDDKRGRVEGPVPENQEPRTEAGKALTSRDLRDEYGHRLDVITDILAIEEQAAAEARRELAKEAWAFLDHITQQDYDGELVDIDVPALDKFRRTLRSSDPSR